MGVLFSLCAFLWHAGDAMLGPSKGHRRVKRLFAGIGVGWSAFFLAASIYKYFTEPRLIETKPWEEIPVNDVEPRTRARAKTMGIPMPKL